VTVKQLAEEVVRRKFPTTSSNVRKLVGIKVGLLVNKGLLRRSPDQAGVLLARPTGGMKTAPGKAASASRGSGKNGAVVSRAATPVQTDGQQHQLPLRVLLTNLLAKSRRPLSARELAEQLLANGYRTKSKNFIDVMWVALGQMKNKVTNVPGKGYILKK